jgi:hypothetical protein
MRISLTDSVSSALFKMSGGNPAATTALLSLVEFNRKVITHILLADGVERYTHPIHLLDEFHIYEENIWLFFADICNQNIAHFVAVLWAIRDGEIPLPVFWQAIEGAKNQGSIEIIDTEKYYAKYFNPKS